MAPDTLPPEPSLAILMLCCRDYEAAELALACHVAYGAPEVPLFAIHNGDGDYDAERTYVAIKRYESLYPSRIRVLTRKAPDTPYRKIRDALRSELQGYDLICKVDDDCFPIAPGWIARLRQAWKDARVRHGDTLAYVTPLINNNNWGFPQTLKALHLEEEFFARFAPEDRVNYGPTIWASAPMARWLHEQTTLQPDRFIAATRDLGPAAIPGNELYSIGCILFRRELWDAIDTGGEHDEIMLWQYCMKRRLTIAVDRSVPFVHLAYFPQREENRDIPRAARDVFEARLGLNHPISAKATPVDELESRLRYLERRIGGDAPAIWWVGRQADGKPGLLRPDLAVNPDLRFLGRPTDELSREEEAAYESNAWAKQHLAHAVPTRKPSETLRRALELAPRGGLALEFGVGSGSTLRQVAAARGDGRVWGFDSFKGLPEAWRPGFPVGAFAMPELPKVPGADLVQGLFDKTLPPFLVEHTDPVDFVHVDCDLYSSTATVLKLLEHRLRPGTVLSFDEYFNYPGWQDHEHKAWTEFVQRTGLRFSYEFYTLGDEQLAVRILD